jgi:hypothetical protein
VTDQPGNAQGAHVTPDVLADLQAGLLHDRAERAAREHLATCPVCRADLELLTTVPGRLAAAGSIEPVPADIASRLDAALAAAAAEPTEGTASTTVVPMLASRRTRSSPRGLRLLQAAAALVVVLGLGGLAVSAIHGGSEGAGSSGTAGAAASAPKSSAVPVTASGRNWTPTTLAAAAPALASGTFGPAFSVYDDSTHRTADSPTATPATPVPTSASKGLASGAAGPAGRLADPTALRACVTNLNDGDQTMQPLAVDLARWQGQPAAVLVFPTADDPASLDVYVVAPDCPTGLFLNFARVPRS